MDYLYNPYTATRHTAFARKGMVATSQPLAAQAGIEIMQKGGNAIDAAIATAAALTVVEPTSNGIGGDAFALVWVKDQLFGLNASGPAPEALTLVEMQKAGHEKMPMYGFTPITVPGVPAAWAALSKRFGKLPLIESLAPAIRYAEEGYPLTPVLGKYWRIAFHKFKALNSSDFDEWFKTFAPDGRPPAIGEMWRSESHAKTLRMVGETNAESFYKGELADRIVTHVANNGGYLRKTDLEKYEVEWVTPMSTNYKGYDVWEIPPNGQGMIALMALNIFSEMNPAVQNDVQSLHEQIESMKRAFVDGKAFITEGADMPIDAGYLLSKEYAKLRALSIEEHATIAEPIELPKGGTVYLATADEEGNMVSFIQSNYMGFGSGIVVPETGIGLQNRGVDFSLDPHHPNVLRPGKRSYNTIIPGFLTKDGHAVGPFGIMGGFMQPQGHFQVVVNTIDYKLNPQAALDAPRWQWVEGNKLLVEPNFPNYLAQALTRKGHQVVPTIDSGSFGRGQIIWRNQQTGVLSGGTESRTDGSIAVW
ncbi:gamma-glutamyltransferase family protein [Sporosarcina contaminans]|uniref:Gamma-glutamyltransferase family protein n=1 Tax=Sporosarcina contaminans TaxID=633403 RepID=A0ABW3U1X6_9BACL